MGIFNLFKKKEKPIIAKCGHETKLEGTISAFGEKRKMKMNFDPGNVEYCLDCIAKMSIICPWCGKPIFVGDHITLYSPVDKDFKIAKNVHVYNQDPLQLVGCQRPSCADTGADYAGFWRPGGVKRELSIIEQLMSNNSMKDSTLVTIAKSGNKKTK